MMVIYDTKFNINEWFILIVIATGVFLIWKVPKRFSTNHSIVYFLYSIYMAMLFDHSLGIPPFDLYDVNDSSNYEFFDFLTYVMYAPFGYFYLYVGDYYKIEPKWRAPYTLAWSLFAMLMEYLAYKAGVFHYKKGYQIYYSLAIYLFVLSVLQYTHKTITPIPNKSKDEGRI